MKFDADPNHPWALAYRIPLTGRSPRYRYEVALVREERNDFIAPRWAACTPTEDEARLIGSYIDFRRSWYNASWAARMLERPFDVDDSTNTVVLLRTATDWAYARTSWTSGPPFVPAPITSPDTAGLVALLDHINRDSNAWAAWKAEHPDLFAALAVAALADTQD